MSKKEVLTGYDDITEGKNQGRFAMILISVFTGIICLIALFFALSVSLSALDKVLVVDKTGRVLPTETKRQEDVFNASIQSHLSNLIYNLNSFDRTSIKENQIKALYLIDKASADRVFDGYNSSGAYNDAVRRGVIYKAQYVKFNSLEGDSEPYLFEVEGILTIQHGSNVKQSKIIGKGKIRYNTPSFPNNTQGFQVYDYLQDFYPIQTEEQ